MYILSFIIFIYNDFNPIDYKMKQKMECLATFTLFGNIMSMKYVKLPGALRDSLLLSFSEAKVKIVSKVWK